MDIDNMLDYYTKSLLKRYIEEQEYLNDLFIQMKTFFIFYFDKKIFANINYLEYKGDGTIEFVSDKKFNEVELALIFLELNLKFKSVNNIDNAYFYIFTWDDVRG